jgi:hypothetical protein
VKPPGRHLRGAADAPASEFTAFVADGGAAGLPGHAVGRNDAAKAFHARAGGGPQPGREHWEIRSPGH